MILTRNNEKMYQDMIRKGLTMTELANRVGCSKATISGIVNEIRNPSPKLAIKICEQLNAQFDEYFFIEGVHKTKREEV